MILMLEKKIKGGIFHWTYHCTKANNEYITNYDKENNFSYLVRWDICVLR